MSTEYQYVQSHTILHVYFSQFGFSSNLELESVAIIIESVARANATFVSEKNKIGEKNKTKKKREAQSEEGEREKRKNKGERKTLLNQENARRCEHMHASN